MKTAFHALAIVTAAIALLLSSGAAQAIQRKGTGIGASNRSTHRTPSKAGATQSGSTSGKKATTVPGSSTPGTQN